MQALRPAVWFFLTWCWALVAPAAEVRLFAAASLADVLHALAPQFAAASGHELQMNFGSSGLLAHQISEGARGDVFFSADETRVDQLERAQLTLVATCRVLVSNQLVLIAPLDAENAPHAFADLATAAVKRIALGEPATVPAGTYARAHLQNVELWDAVAPKIVPLGNVRAVLAAVAAGNVDAGIVYRTDALIEDRVRVVAIVPVAEGPRIRYSAVVLANTRDANAARALLAFLASQPAQAEFARHGFVPLAESP